MTIAKEIEPKTSPEKPLIAGQILKKLREKFGLSQEEVASQAGVSQEYLSQIENDNQGKKNKIRNFRLQSTLGLARTFGEGVLFLEGVKSQKVFLLPLPRRINGVLLTNKGDNADSLEKTLDSISQRYPQVFGENNLIYIDQVDQKTLASRVLEFRAGRFQRLIVEGFEVSQAMISQIETGNIENPKIKTLKEVAKSLNISIEELLGLKEINVHPKVKIIDQILRDERIPLPKRKNLEVLLNSLLRVLTAN